MCHDNGIAHRDVKPQNIVWTWIDEDQNELKVFLIDFGLACNDFADYADKTISYMPGTLYYSAPERHLEEVPPDPRVGDIFAAGLIFFQLVSCCPITFPYKAI